MAGIGSSLISPPRYRPNIERPRSENKRSKIIDVAMKHFAEQGYHAARVGDMATELGIAKGSIFQHFGSKDGLFHPDGVRASFDKLHACYQKAGVPDRCRTRLYDTPHEFNVEMQAEAWEWLKKWV